MFAALVIPMSAITIAVNMNGVSYLNDKLLEATGDKVNYYRDQLNNQITFIRNQGRLANGGTAQGFTPADISVQSHMMAFAAEQATVTGKVVHMPAYLEGFASATI